MRHWARAVPWWDHSLAVCPCCSYCSPVRGIMQSMLQTALSQRWSWCPLSTGWGEEAWGGEVTLPNPYGRELPQQQVKAGSLLLALSHCCTVVAKLIFKLENPLVVSAGTWKQKWRKMKKHQQKVANQLLWPDNRASLCSGRFVPSSAMSVLADGLLFEPTVIRCKENAHLSHMFACSWQCWNCTLAV